MKKRSSRSIKVGFPRHFCSSHIPADKKIDIEQISVFLQNNHLKITKSRLQLIQLFLDNDNHNLTMNTILSKLRKSNEKINVSSVYNNLDTLCRVGILRPNINIFTNQPTFELGLDSVPHIHAFEIEEENQLVMEVDCDLHDAIVALFRKKGYILEDYLIQAVVRKNQYVNNLLEDNCDGCSQYDSKKATSENN